MIEIEDAEHYRRYVATVEIGRRSRDPSPQESVAEVVVASRQVVGDEATYTTVAEPYAKLGIAPVDVLRYSENVPTDDALGWRDAAVEALARDLVAEVGIDEPDPGLDDDEPAAKYPPEH